MKKILTHLTGIAFIIALVACGGLTDNNQNKSATDSDDSNGPGEDLRKVTIYVKVFEEDKKTHLKLSESNERGSFVLDSLHVTDVEPGTKVVWRRAEDSGIKKFERVGPVERGEIFPEDAGTILFHKRYRMKVPDNAKPDTAKYEIEFTVKNDTTIHSVDPYLRIPY